MITQMLGLLKVNCSASHDYTKGLPKLNCLNSHNYIQEGLQYIKYQSCLHKKGNPQVKLPTSYAYTKQGLWHVNVLPVTLKQKGEPTEKFLLVMPTQTGKPTVMLTQRRGSNR